ncbi:MAG: glutamate-5-semialdehyde dehydrogenase, partial [Clostridia bacterium]|nr:glutamate-5-semialdehyde dehydrogenase [Clostridia bacterium]
MQTKEAAQHAKQASRTMLSATHEERNLLLERLKDLLLQKKEQIFEANRLDLKMAEEENLASPLLKRLKLDDSKLGALCEGLDSLISLPDPLGKVDLRREITPGLVLERHACPIGVIGVIFESRPDALIQIGSLCIKSGNAFLLKGGREALNTNRVLISLIQEAGKGILPDGFCALLETREDVQALLSLDEWIDLIVPRGSNAFIRYIMENTRIPVMGHADGICHTYIDRDADTDMAVRVTVDAKCQALAVCNATETLLVHADAAQRILPPLFSALLERGVELRGCERTREICPCKPAEEADWRTEYLYAILSKKIVDSLDEAVWHFNTYGSHLTDAIITYSDAADSRFMQLVDSAGVYRNCSTRFAVGFRYGFGAEVG